MTNISRRDFGKTLGVLGLSEAFPGLASAQVSAPSRIDSVPGGSPHVGPRPSIPAEIDVIRARRETPGAERVLHFNNAGSSLTPTPVLDALFGHLRAEAEMGGYEAAAAAAQQHGRTYEAIATLLGCETEEIALVENATRAWDMAFYAIPLKSGDRILTCEAEYVSNYIAYMHVAKETGAVIEVVPSDADGQISLEALQTELRLGGVGLVGLTHVPTNGGLVNPAEEVGKLTREAGVPYLLDACQSAGQWPLDVSTIGCDILSVTGRKFLRGPRGTGFLYVRKEMIEQLNPPFLDVRAASWTARNEYEIHPTARRFENWESYVAGHIALGVAVDYALEWGIDSIQERVVRLAGELRGALSEIPGVQVRDIGREKCGIVTFTVNGREPSDLKSRLNTRGVNVSVTGRSSTRIDMEARNLQSMVRASVHYYNTENEVERFVTEVAALSR